MAEKLCIFCRHFDWSAEEMYGMGSTMTGPMFEGGFSRCRKGRYDDNKLNPRDKKGDFLREYISTYPKDTDDFRKLILVASDCDDYERHS